MNKTSLTEQWYLVQSCCMVLSGVSVILSTCCSHSSMTGKPNSVTGFIYILNVFSLSLCVADLHSPEQREGHLPLQCHISSLHLQPFPPHPQNRHQDPGPLISLCIHCYYCTVQYVLCKPCIQCCDLLLTAGDGCRAVQPAVLRGSLCVGWHCIWATPPDTSTGDNINKQT